MDLQALFLELNQRYFDAVLPLPKLLWNSRLASTAGRFCPASPRFERLAVIEVATYLRDIPNGAEHIRDTLLHEMIHYWLWHRGRPYGHTAEFYVKMRETGAKRFNPVPKQRPIKYHYQCLHCGTLVPSRRRLGEVACFACCKNLNRGKFDRRFRLQLVTPSKGTVTLPTAAMSTHGLDGEECSPAEILPYSEGFVTEQLSRLRQIVRNAKIRIARPPNSKG